MPYRPIVPGPGGRQPAQQEGVASTTIWNRRIRQVKEKKKKIRHGRDIHGKQLLKARGGADLSQKPQGRDATACIQFAACRECRAMLIFVFV